MTVTPLQAPHGGASRVLHRPRPGRVGRFFGMALAALRQWRKRVHDRNELMALDERTLHDLGLSRSDANYLAGKGGERDLWVESLRFPPF
jgi:uncharacterized protein YjiS (DUF1127 family)